MSPEFFRKRELSGLLEAMDTHALEDGLILTEDKEKTIEKNGRKIDVLPVWKWLLTHDF